MSNHWRSRLLSLWWRLNQAFVKIALWRLFLLIFVFFKLIQVVSLMDLLARRFGLVLGFDDGGHGGSNLIFIIFEEHFIQFKVFLGHLFITIPLILFRGLACLLHRRIWRRMTQNLATRCFKPFFSILLSFLECSKLHLNILNIHDSTISFLFRLLLSKCRSLRAFSFVIHLGAGPNHTFLVVQCRRIL